MKNYIYVFSLFMLCGCANDDAFSDTNIIEKVRTRSLEDVLNIKSISPVDGNRIRFTYWGPSQGMRNVTDIYYKKLYDSDDEWWYFASTSSCLNYDTSEDPLYSEDYDASKLNWGSYYRFKFVDTYTPDSACTGSYYHYKMESISGPLSETVELRDVTVYLTVYGSPIHGHFVTVSINDNSLDKEICDGENLKTSYTESVFLFDNLYEHYSMVSQLLCCSKNSTQLNTGTVEITYGFQTEKYYFNCNPVSRRINAILIIR